MTANKPATPLPWRTNQVAKALGGGAILMLPEVTLAGQNAAYIAHACNAYPKLVQALRECLGAISNRECPTTHERSSTLLRELGENA